MSKRKKNNSKRPRVVRPDVPPGLAYIGFLETYVTEDGGRFDEYVESMGESRLAAGGFQVNASLIQSMYDDAPTREEGEERIRTLVSGVELFSTWGNDPFGVCEQVRAMVDVVKAGHVGKALGVSGGNPYGQVIITQHLAHTAGVSEQELVQGIRQGLQELM